VEAAKSQGCQRKGARDVGGNKDSNAKKLKEFQETMSVEDLDQAQMERAEQLAKERQEAEQNQGNVGKLR
jgi:hypothetical protein